VNVGLSWILLGPAVVLAAAAGPAFGSETQRCTGLALSVDFPQAVRAGEAVRFTVLVRNRSDTVCTVYLGGRPPHDVEVRLGSSLVWNWAHGRPTLLVLDVRQLGPGEELRFEAVWDQRDNRGRPVRPGRYRVRALVRVDESPQVLRTSARTLIITP
jgi:hypothetical protein